MKLRVIRKSHTKGGKTFTAGMVFDGTERELSVFSDRLERVVEGKPKPATEQRKAGRPKKEQVNTDGDANTNAE